MVDYVIFDLETTGLHPGGGDRIAEFGAVRFEDQVPVEEFSSLVNPLRPISPGAARVNGLTSEMLSDAPTVEVVLPQFLEFVGDAALVAHNAVFDISFLVAEARRVDLDPPSGLVICTCELSRALLPNLKSHSLSKLVLSLNLGRSVEHRALADVYATSALLDRLVDLAGIYSLPELAGRHGGPIPWPELNPDDVLRELPEEISAAMQSGSGISVSYVRADGQVTSRTIEPLSAYRRAGCTYIVAHCRLRKAERTFRLDRFLEVGSPE